MFYSVPLKHLLMFNKSLLFINSINFVTKWLAKNNFKIYEKYIIIKLFNCE